MTSEPRQTEIRFPDGGHPDAETLDMHRCGLLDEDPSLHARVREHLATCAVCAGSDARWRSVGEALDRGFPLAPTSELAARREAVLIQSGSQTRSRAGQGFRTPLFAVAASALLAMAGATLFLAPGESPLIDGPQQVAIEDEAQMYSDIEFFLWISENPEAIADVPSDNS